MHKKNWQNLNMKKMVQDRFKSLARVDLFRLKTIKTFAKLQHNYTLQKERI